MTLLNVGRLTVLLAAGVLSFVAAAGPTRIRVRSDLRQARDRVREMKVRGLPEGGVEVVLSGTFRMSEPLDLDARDSGEPGRPIVWRGEGAVLDGGFRATDWTPGTKAGEWTCDLKRGGCAAACAPFVPFGTEVREDDTVCEMLFRDGRPLPLARDPDAGWHVVGETVDRTNFLFRANGFDCAKWASSRNGFAHGFWTKFWADEAVPFAVDPVARTIRLTPGECRYWTVPVTNHNFCLRGCAEAMDRPDEWYLDRARGVLHVQAGEGGLPRGEYVFCETELPFVRLRGVSDVRFENLACRYGRGDCLVGDGVTNVTVRGCTVSGFGGWGVRFKRAQGCGIVRSRLFDFGHGAALLVGGDRRTLESGENVFADNDVHRTGLLQLTYSPGLLLGGVGGRVAHNHFHDMPSSALRLGGNDHLVESNVVERCVLVSDDQGALDIYGNPTYLGIKIRWNVWRDIGGGGPFAPCGQSGVRFDDYVSGMLVFGNRFDNCTTGGFGGVQSNGGRGNVIENNLFTRCRYALSMTLLEAELWNRRWEVVDLRESYVTSAAWTNHYPILSALRGMPRANVIRRNVIVGAVRLLNGDKAGALDDMPTGAGDNVLLPAGAAVDPAEACPGFVPLPPESALGMRWR